MERVRSSWPVIQAFCPALNPVESCGPGLKRRALANFCAANLGELNTPELGILTERLGAREQMLALLEIPTTSWLGQRNRLLLTLLYNTGARVSEMLACGSRTCAQQHTFRSSRRQGPRAKGRCLCPCTATRYGDRYGDRFGLEGKKASRR